MPARKSALPLLLALCAVSGATAASVTAPIAGHGASAGAWHRPACTHALHDGSDDEVPPPPDPNEAPPPPDDMPPVPDPSEAPPPDDVPLVPDPDEAPPPDPDDAPSPPSP
jgi:DNA polymerase-3 subunit gamma/tau